MKEQGYSEDDSNRPHAGDCVIGMKHNEDYYCEAHQYLQGIKEYEHSNNKPIKKLKPNYCKNNFE